MMRFKFSFSSHFYVKLIATEQIFFQRLLCITKLIFSCAIYIDFKLTETCQDSFVGMERKDGFRGYTVSNEIREIKRNSGIGDLEENT